MPSIYYLDKDLGSDSVTATPLGWWSVAFNGGSGVAPTADDVCTGATSGHHGHLTVCTITSGNFATNNASGVLYFYGCDDLIHNGEQVDWHDGHCHTTGAAVYCAWKTIAGGPTAARTGDNDVIRIAKTAAGVKLPGATGQATWTKGSRTVTLAEAQTANIDMCETAWTAVVGGDVASVTASPYNASNWLVKEGTNAMKFTMDAAIQTNKQQAYFPTGTLNLSAYQQISLWVYHTAQIPSAIKIQLCTGADGTGVVDEFTITAAQLADNGGRWKPINVFKDGGGNLSNGINSIAWSTTGTVATGMNSTIFGFDNIIACTTTGLTLRHLISKNTLEQMTVSPTNYGNEPWYAIASINGTTITLAGCESDAGVTAFNYYGGDTELVDTYYRLPLWNTLVTGIVFNLESVQENGLTFSGGWDPATNEQNGETIWDGSNQNGSGIYNTKLNTTITRMSFVRFAQGIMATNAATTLNIGTIPLIVSCSTGISLAAAGVQIDTLIAVVNCTTGIGGTTSNGVTVNYIDQINCTHRSGGNPCHAIRMGNNCHIKHIRYIAYPSNSSGGAYCIKFEGYGSVVDYIKEIVGTSELLCVFDFSSVNNLIRQVDSISGCTNIMMGKGPNKIGKFITDGTETNVFTLIDTYANCLVHCNSYNGKQITYYDWGTCEMQAATAGGSGNEWKVTVNFSTRIAVYPIAVNVAKIYATAGEDLTVTIYVKKDHATDIHASLFCPAYTLPGITTDQEDECPDDTSRNQLSITVSPTVNGVVDFYVHVWTTSSGLTNGTFADSSVSPGVKTKVNVSAGHGLTDGDYVRIYGTTSGQYDGLWQISNVTATTYDITKVFGTNPSSKGSTFKFLTAIIDDIDYTSV